MRQLRLWLSLCAVAALSACACAQAPSGSDVLLPPRLAVMRPDSSVQSPRGEEGVELRKPAVALALSVIVPGAGQVYNGQIAKGVVFAGMFYGGIVLLNRANITKSHSSVTAVGWMGIILVAGTHITNMIDAATTAEKQFDSGAPLGDGVAFRFGSHRMDVGMSLSPHAAGVYVALTL